MGKNRVFFDKNWVFSAQNGYFLFRNGNFGLELGIFGQNWVFFGKKLSIVLVHFGRIGDSWARIWGIFGEELVILAQKGCFWQELDIFGVNYQIYVN